MLTLAAVNTNGLYRSQTKNAQARNTEIENLIADLAADVLAVQMLTADDPTSSMRKRTKAEERLRRLAAAVGRDCEVGGQPAIATGAGIHHTGLLWRDSIHPVPGSLHRLVRGMSYGMVNVVLDLGGLKARIGSVHLPTAHDLAFTEAGHLLGAFHRDGIPGLLGGDFAGTASHQGYDPDPYDDVPWHPAHVTQLDDSGAVDRRAAHRLEAEHLGRMRDCARLTGTPWIATTGHHPTDNHPPRRPNRWYTTHDFPDPAIAGYTVTALDHVGDILTHLPVLLTLDLDALAR